MVEVFTERENVIHEDLNEPLIHEIGLLRWKLDKAMGTLREIKSGVEEPLCEPALLSNYDISKLIEKTLEEIRVLGSSSEKD